MNSIEEKIEIDKSKKGYSFIPYLMSAYPDYENFIKYAKVLEKFSKVMEIGIPYSDPVADGPIIQEAHSKLMEKKISLENLIQASAEIKSSKVIMTYYNPVYRLGVKRFVSLLVKNDVEGLLIPDLPVELSGEIRRETASKNISTIFLVTPNTNKERMMKIIEFSQGFIYLVQRYGVTGESDDVYFPIENVIMELKKITTKEVCVGFGVSNPDHIRKLVKMGADGIIVGSYLIRLISSGTSIERFEKELRSLVVNLSD